MVADEVVAEMRRFAAALVDMGVARPGEVLSCSEEEVRAVLDRAADFPLPSHYLAFLEILGRGAGRLFRGTGIYFPEPIEANDYAIEFSEQDPRLDVAGRFFFATHQGYQFYFFDRMSSGTVFMYTEGQQDAQTMTSSFLEFLWQSARSEASSSTTGL
jgi:hypothetical protein